jgi:SulP family sulfate permease
VFHAFSTALREDRSFSSLQSNVLAGLTVGVIALPLSMALAIASGVPPQHGLYTAMVAGIVIALSGGSQVNISGPTAAFVVILLPIVQKFGLGGLMVSGFMAGIILIAMGLGRLGRLVEVVPYPVTIGFTAGIGVVIATLQLKDFLGLQIENLDGHFTHKVALIFENLTTLHAQEFFIGALTFAVLLLWPRMRSRIPGHLVALGVGTLVAWLASITGLFDVETIGTRFHYSMEGLVGSGIPPLLPELTLPWNQPGPDGAPLGLSFELVRKLMGAALTIAILGAIESLLCAVIADGLSGKKHDPNDELIGQGIGNLLVPLFGGVPATAAIARTTANIRSGGSTPLSSVVHGLFILLSILLLAPLLAYIPMASMAALLLMVAWNMSDAHQFVRTLRVAPRADVIVLMTCFLLTVLFDMVIAVGVGMGLAGILFIRRSISLTEMEMLSHHTSDHPDAKLLPDNVVLYDINGPLFFGTAQTALNIVTGTNPGIRAVILEMSGVTMLDMSALMAIESIVKDMKKKHICLVIASLEARMIVKLRHAGIRKQAGTLSYAGSVEAAILKLEQGCAHKQVPHAQAVT